MGRSRVSPLVACALAVTAAAKPGSDARDWVEWLRQGGIGSTFRGEKDVEVEVVSQTGVLTDAVEAAVPALDPEVHDDAAPSKWAPLETLLKGWQFTSNYSIVVGDAKSRKFLYEGGTFTHKTLIPTGSTSKWPSAMLFAGLVGDGTVKSLDDPVNKYLSWWTKDPKDERSKVTFKMLLQFTSGFGDGHPGEVTNTRAAREWRAKNNVAASRAHMSLRERLEEIDSVEPAAASACDTTKGDILECGKSIYNNVKLIGTPGTVYSYNSNHLQLAATVAVTLTGMDIHAVVKKYLLEPYDMKASYYAGKCPDFGGSLMTTGEDYENFLRGLLTYKTLPKSLIEASEEDGTPFMADYYTLYGDYAFGHFLMCFDSVDGFTEACKAEKCHMDPGAFGFIPIIDRKRGYYLQLTAAEIAPTGSYPLSGIPEYLAVAIKKNVDAIVSQSPPSADHHLHYTPEFLSMGVVDVNYCLDCKLNPSHCD
eukprot:TRINITY_DN10449_c0_g1_i3.p1 TRINITY_DN10449_c0_g1~~TRINITY_DN10449_c0_g1_i3.p1  ORF type:complete len:479 (-),score=110.92 TRINITY_DN10449_c0_g1_i3:238-1674(-)